MSKRLRQLTVMLLLLVLPWHTLAAGMHEHDAGGLPTSAEASVASSGDEHAHHAGHHQRADGGVTSVHHGESVPNAATPGAMSIECMDVCCFTALIGTGSPQLPATDRHGLVIPFFTHPFPSRAPDSLERPPSSSSSSSVLA
jgi:hypothetical protein